MLILGRTFRAEVADFLDVDDVAPVKDLTLGSLDADLREVLVELFGRRVISNVYRQLLLSVITELWVDYLTQMEALRVSIGLEAYAQRDPLVQYKARASELFQTLQSNIRLGVISRMFTYQPRDISRVQTNLALEEETESGEPIRLENDEQDAGVDLLEPGPASDSEMTTPANGSGSKKKRRRRR